jgi:hypothetical protein
VVIYGATVAGIGAAYTARLMGEKVLLIQHDRFGGMTGAGGLTNLDLYYPNVQGGIWWQMRARPPAGGALVIDPERRRIVVDVLMRRRGQTGRPRSVRLSNACLKKARRRAFR